MVSPDLPDLPPKLPRKVEGNLATARTMASKALAAIEEDSPSPFVSTRTAVPDLLDGFSTYCESVRQLAPRTVDRYRAALDHFKQFAEDRFARETADRITEDDVEDFVQWLRRQPRRRNGAATGRAGRYSSSGIAFILSVCACRPARQHPFRALTLRLDWKAFLPHNEAEVETANIRLATSRGRPLASDALLSKLEKRLNRRLRPLPVGRPKEVKR